MRECEIARKVKLGFSLVMSLWTVVLFALPMCSYSVDYLEISDSGYNIFSPFNITIASSGFSFLVYSLIIIFVLLALACIAISIINFFIDNSTLSNVISALVVSLTFASLFYMIIGLTTAATLKWLPQFKNPTSYSYVFFLISVLILVCYFLVPYLIVKLYSPLAVLSFAEEKHFPQKSQPQQFDPVPDVPLQLKKYKELLDNNIITLEDFEKIKAKLLDL